MHIIIDGYNLIGTAHQNIEEERDQLIEALSEYSKIKGHDVTVVFDGWKNGPGPETTMKVRGIRVIYSRLSEKADRVIMRIISEEQKAWVVISSDREIVDFTYSKEMVPVTSDEFERRLISAIESASHEGEEIPDDEDKYDDLPPTLLKGAQRKLSKKQKMKSRALKKL